MPNRRQNRRWPRRVQVRFWRPEQPAQVYQGFTSDVSETGAFIVTGTPIGTHARIRVELLTDEGGFVAEAIVRRSLHLHRELSLKSSGMGVRFLSVTELIQELLPHAEVVEQGVGDNGANATAQADAYAEQTISAESIVAATNEAEKAAGPTAPMASPSAPPAASGGHLRELAVRFRGLEDLRLIYERDLQHGGLFVATTTPPAVGTRIKLALYLPGSAQPVLAEAQVVHVFEPDAPTVRSRNLLTGMGILFDDASPVLALVRPLLAGSGSLPRSGP